MLFSIFNVLKFNDNICTIIVFLLAFLTLLTPVMLKISILTFSIFLRDILSHDNKYTILKSESLAYFI